MGRDQPDNAVRIAVRGAGLKLAPDASAADIAAAVTQVLEDPSFAAAAKGWGARIRAEGETRGDVACDSLEALQPRT